MLASRGARADSLDNDGDWVDSCTALVEHLDGRMEILELGRGLAGEEPPPEPPEAHEPLLREPPAWTRREASSAQAAHAGEVQPQALADAAGRTIAC